MKPEQSAIPPGETEPVQKDYPQHGFATIPRAGDFLQVGRTTVYAMIAAGMLASMKIRGARRIPWAALHKLADDAVQSSTSLDADDAVQSSDADSMVPSRR